MWTFSASPSRFSLTATKKKYSFNTEKKKKIIFFPHLLAVGFSFPLIQLTLIVCHTSRTQNPGTQYHIAKRRRRRCWWESFFSTLPDVEELIIATYRENIIELLSLTRREFCRPFFYIQKKNHFFLYFPSHPNVVNRSYVY